MIHTTFNKLGQLIGIRGFQLITLLLTAITIYFIKDLNIFITVFMCILSILLLLWSIIASFISKDPTESSFFRKLKRVKTERGTLYIYYDLSDETCHIYVDMFLLRPKEDSFRWIENQGIDKFKNELRDASIKIFDKIDLEIKEEKKKRDTKRKTSSVLSSWNGVLFTDKAKEREWKINQLK